MIEADVRVEKVEFEYYKLHLRELSSDQEDVLTSVQIRMEGEDILIFIDGYDRQLHCKRMKYTEFREKLTKMIDDPKTGEPI
jgi:hypothetical protein